MVGSWKGNWGLSLLYKERLSWCERCIKVTYVLSEHWWNDDCGEEEGSVVIFTPRGAVCWVFFAGNISCVEMDIFCFCEGMNVLEDFVCGLVLASGLPPTLDDTSVVTEDLEVSVSGSRWGESEDEDPEANCLCPANFPAISFPTWEKSPSSPPAPDCDPNASFQASI